MIEVKRNKCEKRYGRQFRWALLGMALFCLLFTGCIREGSLERIRDLEFTVLPQSEIPLEYLDFIEANKAQPLKLTYMTEEYMYIAVGYGEQSVGGYSISVDELYLTENAIVIDTTLHGPKESELEEIASYPYLVVKLEKIELPILFK